MIPIRSNINMFVMYFCFIVAIVIFFMTLYQFYKNDNLWKYGAFLSMFNLMLAIYNGISVLIDKIG